MLLEQLVEKNRQPPQYDWDGYYRWLFGRLTGREGGEITFWLCSRCLTVNLLTLPVRYGKCRSCDLLHLP